MGLPALIISERIVDNLEELLTSHGVKVHKQPVSKELHQQQDLPQFEFLCSIADSDKVILNFGRLNATPNQLVVSLRAVPSAWWKFKADTKLLKEIESVLRENGATDLPMRKAEK